MSQCSELIGQMKIANYREKQQLFAMLLQTLERNRKVFSKEDEEALLTFAYGETENMCRDIPNCATYREKTDIFDCADSLFGIIVTLDGTPDRLPNEKALKLRALVETIRPQRYIENAVENVFKQKTITETEITQLLYWAGQTDDEYQKGILFLWLLKHRNDFNKLNGKARLQLSDYMASEILRLMAIDNEDAKGVLELLAALCSEFPTEKTISALLKLLKLGHNNINYHAVATLFSLGRDVPQNAIEDLARDLEYAHLTYYTLQRHRKTELFPVEYATEEYLAKSDMVHWLTYPTELGKAPDAIEYIGKIKKLFSKEVFHVFKFRSDSDTLDDGLKNKWLIGWSSNEGGTFSNFDEFAPFEQGTTEKTLKLIKKKIIG
ncbi:MAG: hypothetical protein E7453_03865 [Ruminococcaceae bacterium]|nr:hypothetical protein [Oscillospiraceae bacterium]